jgi:UDP-4-amino-4,6-dideoxy-N-acetyl-beta-L-altrosamine transaminase
MMKDASAVGYLPYGRHDVREEDVLAVLEALRSEWWTTGPRVGLFEDALCAVTGAGHAVAVSSGTAALHSMYAGVGLGLGDEIITSPLTFCATANAAHYLGARVRFVDVDPRTGNLDPQSVAAAVGPRTRAVVAVDYAGHPADYAALQSVCDAYGLVLLADAAHSLGARLGGVRVGRLCDASAVSLHPVKPISTGEGGAVLTDDAELARRVRSFRSHGIERDPSRFVHPADGPWSMEQQELGFNYRLTDLQAALGTSQVQRLDALIARRRMLAERWSDRLRGLPGLLLPEVLPGAESGWHLYVVRTEDPGLRRPLFEALRRAELGVQVHYVPVYRHAWYRAQGYGEVVCRNAEDWYARCISLPLYPSMTDAEFDVASERVEQAWKEVRR